MSASFPHIASVTTTLPPYRVTQEEAQRICHRIFANHPRLEKLLAIFEHAGVKERYFSFPIEYYLNGHTFLNRDLSVANLVGTALFNSVDEPSKA